MRHGVIVNKPWGREVIWASTDQYVGKLLYVKAGEATSLQYHEEKVETIRVLSGWCVFHFAGVDSWAGPGFTCHVPPHVDHRISAIEDTVVLEVSTPQLHDVVRVDDRYDRSHYTP